MENCEIMAIYTKTGDKGETSLANGQRVQKSDARIEAYGTVDELNSWVGMVRAGLRDNGEAYPQPLPVEGGRDWKRGVDEQLAKVQNKLFNIGASLSCAPGEWISEADVKEIEGWIDAMQAETPAMRAFVLPSGSEVVARCHVGRTICRRAERRMWEAYPQPLPEGKGVLGELKYMNRLSDYLFVLARFLGYKGGEKEEIWQK